MKLILCLAALLALAAASTATAAGPADASQTAKDRDCGTIQFPATVTRDGVTRRSLWSAVVDIPRGSIGCPAARTVIRAYARYGVVRPAWSCYGDLFTRGRVGCVRTEGPKTWCGAPSRSRPEHHLFGVPMRIGGGAGLVTDRQVRARPTGEGNP